MTDTYKQAYDKAAKYLAICSGYPKNVRVQLYKTDQQFNTSKNCHELTFTMYVKQPEQVDMSAPLSESSESWGLIQQVNHEVGLVENKQAIRFFQTDFNRFARILMKQLGYGQDYVVRIPSVSQSHDSKNYRDIYNIRLHIEKPSKPTEVMYESNNLPILRELQHIYQLNQ